MKYHVIGRNVRWTEKLGPSEIGVCALGSFKKLKEALKYVEGLSGENLEKFARVDMSRFVGHISEKFNGEGRPWTLYYIIPQKCL